MQRTLSDAQKRRMADNYLEKQMGRPSNEWALLPDGLTPTDIGEAMERHALVFSEKSNAAANWYITTIFITTIIALTIGIIAGVSIGRAI